MRFDITPLVDRLRSLSRQTDARAVREELDEVQEVDLAQAIARMPLEEGIEILLKLDAPSAAEVFIELPRETARQMAEELPEENLAQFLDLLPMDDALSLREIIEEERFDRLLNTIPKEDAQEIRRILAYPEDSVGRIMTERFFKVGPEQELSEILADIRRSSDEKYESIYDIYVLDEQERLMGVFSLRRAVRSRPDLTARDVMNDDYIACHAEDPAEQAARELARYGFRALPVADSRGRMVGVLTADDAQFIISQADSEDVLMLGAVSGDADSYLSLSPFQIYKRRIFWLIGLFFAETLTTAVMQYYGKGEDANLPAIMVYLPLIIGAGGNTGSQTTTTITRALALGEVHTSDVFHVMRHEFITALMIGATLGVAGFLRAHFFGVPGFAPVVAASLPLVTTWACLIGSMLPIAAKRINIDPAVMSAPFISTFVDATGIIIYFEVALHMVGKIG